MRIISNPNILNPFWRTGVGNNLIPGWFERLSVRGKIIELSQNVGMTNNRVEGPLDDVIARKQAAVRDDKHRTGF